MEADFRNHGASKLGPKPGLEIQVADGKTRESQGQRVLLSPMEIDTMNFKILAAMSDRQMSFFIPREQPIELLFFRRIFTRLREQKARANEISGRSMHDMPEDVDENIPIQAFQRAMGRLFYVMRDPQGFDSKVYDQNGNGYVGWGEFCYVWKDRKITVRLSWWERIFLTCDDPQSSYMARLVSVFTLLTIVMSSLGFILSTVPEFQETPADGSAPKPGKVFEHIENCCLIIFVIEYLIRICTCWAIRDEVFDKALLLEMATGYERIQLSSPVMRVIKFIFNIQNLIDLAAILPGVVTGLSVLFTGDASSGGGGFVVLRLVRLTRIFRAFRLGKYVEPVLVIARTVKQSTKALYVLAFNLLLGVVIFGSLMFLMEQGEWDPDTHEYWRVVDYKWNATADDFDKVLGITPFKSIPHAFWWALVTSTTVGYGDHYPTTSNGYIVAVVCMVWSLVILALPVGVIGGTFTQVWDDFAKNKKVQAELFRREMVYVAHAIQKIQPCKVSRLLTLEVWNDDGQYEQMPASPEDFMGEVKIELELSPDFEVKGKEMRLPLQPNYSVVKREITGSITVRYDWYPAEPRTAMDHADEVEEGDYAPREKLLHGTLRLEIINAENLINTDWGKHIGRSSPYVLALCYPVSPTLDDQLVPVVWRSATAQHTLNPVWQCGHDFEYLWHIPIDTVESRSKAFREGSFTRQNSNRDKVTRFCEPGASGRSPSSGTSVQPFIPDSPGPDEVMSMLLQLTVSMPKLTCGLAQIQEQVVSLTGRVDHLQASLQRSGGGEGPGRPSHDLRGLARCDAASPGHSLQPGGSTATGRERDPKRDRSDLNNGAVDVSSPVLEDSRLEDVRSVGMLVNGGPSALAMDIVADAASLPHAIPHGPNG
jgi:hypothetical protein